MENVSKKLMETQIPLPQESNVYTKEIAEILEKSSDYQLNITKQNEFWKLSIEEWNIELITVYTQSPQKGYEVLIMWLKNFYGMMNHQPFTTEISERANSLSAKITRNGKTIDSLESKDDLFWIILKQKSIKQVLYRPVINLLLTTDELTPLNICALEYFLLDNYCMTSRRKSKESVATSLISLKDRQDKELEIPMNIISSNKYPNLRSHLLRSNIRMFIKKEESLMLRATLMNIDTGETLEDVQNTSLPSLLEEMEFNLKNRKIRIRKSE